jgi:hypothetical protein
MGTRRYTTVLSVDNDNEFRSRCEWIWVRLFGSTTYVSPQQPWKNHDWKSRKIMIFEVKKKSFWCGAMTPRSSEDRAISMFAGFLTNHDRTHSPTLE